MGKNCYKDTADLDVDGMAAWYTDYLNALRLIGLKNRVLIEELLDLDQESGVGREFPRFRGLPKIIDKVIWWCGGRGKTDGDGLPIKLFLT